MYKWISQKLLWKTKSYCISIIFGDQLMFTRRTEFSLSLWFFSFWSYMRKIIKIMRLYPNEKFTTSLSYFASCFKSYHLTTIVVKVHDCFALFSVPFIYHRFDERSGCAALSRRTYAFHTWKTENTIHTFVSFYGTFVTNMYISSLRIRCTRFHSFLFLFIFLFLSAQTSERYITAMYLLPPIVWKRHDTSVLYRLTLPLPHSSS